MNDLIQKLQQICRVCLLENSLMFSVLHRGCTNQNICTMIMTCTSVKVDLDDNLPQLVCSGCLERLEIAYLFKQECERSEITLRKILSENGQAIDNKYTQIDPEKTNENDDSFASIDKNASDSFSECDGINASTMVKVEMEVDDDEVEIKNEPSDRSSDEDYSITTRRKKILRKTNKVKRKTLNKSIEKIKRRNIFKCVVCDKDFRHHKRYWLHTKEHPNFTCYICWKRFKDLELLEKHNEEHPNQLYVCDQDGCDLRFTNCRSFVLHKKNDHEIKEYLHCAECNKSFDSHEKWDIHVQKHLRSKQYCCEICQKEFSQKASLENHMELHNATYKCDQCDGMYTSRTKLERHKRIHGTNSFICEECGRKYNQKYNLKKHIDVAHKGKKPPKRVKSHLCPHCGQTFARPVDLTTHIRIHTGSKPFSCDKCDYKCHDKQLLRSHSRIHTGLRPYKCEYCGKSFGSRSYLTVHKRFHTGYRPYICSQCTKGFTNSKDLKVHERTHTGIKLYHCNICNNSFTTLHYLKVHTKKHEAQ